MSKKDEALKLALEALERYQVKRQDFDRFADEITAIRVALASKSEALAHAPTEREQPAQPKCNSHPKAPHGFDRNASHSADRYVCDCESWDPYDAGYQAGYEACLKREEALDAMAEQPAHGAAVNTSSERVEKQAQKVHEQPAQQQEPVAWATRMGEYAHIHWGSKRPEYPVRYEVPLYTTPPAAPASQEEIQRLSALVRAQQITIEKLESQRQWVGLTDEEKNQVAWSCGAMSADWLEFADAIEAKLREKNT